MDFISSYAFLIIVDAFVLSDSLIVTPLSAAVVVIISLITSISDIFIVLLFLIILEKD